MKPWRVILVHRDRETKPKSPQIWGAPVAWDEDRRALLRAELDAWYARAYGPLT
jgi:hypothetical protein